MKQNIALFLTTSSPTFWPCYIGLSGLQLAFCSALRVDIWYRTLFDNFEDHSTHSLQQVSSLDDIKSTSHTDNNAAKTIALDHLGVIAARIRSSMLKFQKVGNELGSKSRTLKSLDEVHIVSDIFLIVR